MVGPLVPYKTTPLFQRFPTGSNSCSNRFQQVPIKSRYQKCNLSNRFQQLEPVVTCWNTSLESAGTYWNLMESVGTFLETCWNRLELVGTLIVTSWNLLERLHGVFIGTCWNPLKPVGMYQLKPVGTYWKGYMESLLEPFGTCWNP